MKTAKRLCAALLALALIFTLAGCNAQTTEPTPTPTPEPTPVPTPSPSPTTGSLETVRWGWMRVFVPVYWVSMRFSY